MHITSIFRRAPLAAAIVVAAGAIWSASPSVAESARVVPAPAVDASAPQKDKEVAVLAGGCFWGVQGVFQHVDGVVSAVSGYAGGAAETARYPMVSTNSTGHAEAVQVTYDPRKISYGRLLQIYFSVAHNPTELNRQGPDVGSQYRSTVFAADGEQARVASAYISQLNQSRAFSSPVVTTVETGREFYAAEAYHQNYLTNHPDQPYIVINDLPKLTELKRVFSNVYRASPTLVAAR